MRKQCCYFKHNLCSQEKTEVWRSASITISCVIFRETLKPPRPQFPHLQNVHGNIHLTVLRPWRDNKRELRIRTRYRVRFLEPTSRSSTFVDSGILTHSYVYTNTVQDHRMLLLDSNVSSSPKASEPESTDWTAERRNLPSIQFQSLLENMTF